jgi:hypothetical protein
VLGGFLLALGGLPAAAQPTSAAEAMRLAYEGAQAAEAKDFAGAVARLEAAVALRPDLPRLFVDLAAAQVALEQHDEAIGTLQRLARLGVHSPVDKAEEFTPLRARNEFQEVVKSLATNLHPKGSGEIAFTLRDVTGLIEGIAWREKTGEFYFGDVHGRAVWLRNKDGSLRRFTAEGEDLLGVFGLAVDEANGSLWAATSAVPAMSGFTPDMEGTAALAELDLATGAVKQVYPVARGQGGRHLLGDVALTPEGAVLLPDSATPVVWRLAPGGKALEEFAGGPELLSLQGIAVLPSGVAVLSDQINGLLRLDLSNGRVDRLEPPPDTTLIGIDGLTPAPDGHVLALQSGVRPVRVLRVELDGAAESLTSVAVLESGHIAMASPSLGCLATDGDFFYIGNPGWNRFASDDGRPTAPRPVPIFRTKLATKK